MTDHHRQFYIDGDWVAPISDEALDVINPATEQAYATIALGNIADAERAIASAKQAFPSFSRTHRAERVALLTRILECYKDRMEDIARAISDEMGAPLAMARASQAQSGYDHIEATIAALADFEFEEQRGTSRIRREPIGVVGLITPWNWPMNQIACKVAPAIAAGCTIVLKPSEVSPISGLVFAEIMHAAKVPPGVFNLVNGDGPTVGRVLSRHPDIDMISFTGSTRVGIEVAKAAADTVKRVAQELGGKSANIILQDADFVPAIENGVLACLGNSGQSCDAPARMLVSAERHDEALAIARKTADAIKVGDPRAETTELGPVVSQVQFDKIQRLIGIGIAEGATLAAGGPGRPQGLNYGYYVRPTVFGHVKPDMTIAREEIFGPVLAIMPYATEDEAIRIANDTPYGLAGYVQSTDIGHARDVARQIRAGQIHINYPVADLRAPFGGFKQSGNGREYADWGLHDYLEVKGIIGFGVDT